MGYGFWIRVTRLYISRTLVSIALQLLYCTLVSTALQLLYCTVILKLADLWYTIGGPLTVNMPYCYNKGRLLWLITVIMLTVILHGCDKVVYNFCIFCYKTHLNEVNELWYFFLFSSIV